MRIGHQCLLPLALAVPLLLQFAARAADDSPTCTYLWLDCKIAAEAAHKLALDLEVRGCSFRWPSWAIVERHELTLKLLQAAVDQLLA